jgi:uncharacterized protein with PIN domain
MPEIARNQVIAQFGNPNGALRHKSLLYITVLDCSRFPGFSMFDTIKAIIGDIASGAIKDQRIELSREQLSVLDSKLKGALDDNKTLRQRLAELEGQLQRLASEETNEDECPYCKKHTGKLVNLKPHPQALLAHVGTKIAFYQCGNEHCGKSYDRQIRQ